MLPKRKEKLRKDMKSNSIDCIVLSPSTSLRYLTGQNFKKSERLFLYFFMSNGEEFYFTPQVERSKLEEQGCINIFSYTDNEGIETLFPQFKKILEAVSTIAIEPLDFTYYEISILECLGNFNFKNATEIITRLRIVKDEIEIENLRHAVSILEQSLKEVLPYFEEGRQEIEIAALLEYELRKRGSEGTPFSTIVASGNRGALPHGRASEKTLKAGELVVVDFGSIFNGYVGDMTRMVAVGQPSSFQQEVYEVVRQTIERSIAFIEMDMPLREIDHFAREFITNAGYGDYFTHRLGHGIGLNGHEPPYVSQTETLTIEEGMTFTIEPGIYLKDRFGIRIEDNIVILSGKAENLMSIDHKLIIT